jgi:hypothetical protein
MRYDRIALVIENTQARILEIGTMMSEGVAEAFPNIEYRRLVPAFQRELDKIEKQKGVLTVADFIGAAIEFKLAAAQIGVACRGGKIPSKLLAIYRVMQTVDHELEQPRSRPRVVSSSASE